MTPQRLCLGVVGMTLFDRTPESLGQAQQRRSLPIEEKESFRWLEGFRLASELAAEVPDTQIISVADREGDLYDIFVEAGSDPAAADFVIRAKEQRCTPERDTGPEDGLPGRGTATGDDVSREELSGVLQSDRVACAERDASEP